MQQLHTTTQATQRTMIVMSVMMIGAATTAAVGMRDRLRARLRDDTGAVSVEYVLLAAAAAAIAIILGGLILSKVKEAAGNIDTSVNLE